MSASPTFAGDDQTPDGPSANPPYCRADEPHAPDGVIVQVGDRWFRLCAHVNGTPDERLIRVTLNPELFPDISFIEVFIGLSLDSRFSYNHWASSSRRGLEPKGIRKFGGVPFQVFDSGNYGPNGLAGRSAYFPVVLNVANTSGPDYHVTCIGESDQQNDTARCSVVIRYFDLVGLLGIYQFDGGTRRLPYDHFPSFPAEMMRVLTTADITDTLGE